MGSTARLTASAAAARSVGGRGDGLAGGGEGEGGGDGGGGGEGEGGGRGGGGGGHMDRTHEVTPSVGTVWRLFRSSYCMVCELHRMPLAASSTTPAQAGMCVRHAALAASSET